MRLVHVEIVGYRSILKKTHLHLEPDVTIVLGPNDHGKTNCLSALLHLNVDCPFVEDVDLNWDSTENADSLPAVTATFALSPDEATRVVEVENRLNEEHNQKVLTAPAAKPEEEAGDPAPSTPASEEEEIYDLLKPEQLGRVVVRRVGVGGGREVLYPARLFKETEKLIESMIPRFELINPVAKLSDSVTAQELAADSNEFMRGIFYYAGIDPDDCAELFNQTDKTMRRLASASKTLDKTLRETWSQGRGLEFKLQHDSKHQRIELLIEDPAVNSRFVRASRRSSGFTHYFALKTILHARQRDHAANSYFLMFDEPGIYLHPSGQYDLLQVLETLAKENQLAYVTHSLFMINKTFPSRHRLLMKGDGGTTLNGKPYVGRWEMVLGALGMTVTGTILFANYVVLTEGDSDPIYLYTVLQRGIRAGKCRIDLNPLAFVSTVESKHADVLLRLLLETTPRPKLGVITDGDQGGKDRLVYLNAVMKDQSIPDKALVKDTSLEDHLPNLREVFVPAVADYVGKLLVLRGETKPDEDEFRRKFLDHFDKAFEKGKVTARVMDWVKKAGLEIGGLPEKEKPSKVGIAREYAARLTALPDDQLRWEQRTAALVDWLVEKVGVPELRELEKSVLQEA